MAFPSSTVLPPLIDVDYEVVVATFTALSVASIACVHCCVRKNTCSLAIDYSLNILGLRRLLRRGKGKQYREPKLRQLGRRPC